MLFFFGHCFTVTSRASLTACALALVVETRNSFCVLLYLESKFISLELSKTAISHSCCM